MRPPPPLALDAEPSRAWSVANVLITAVAAAALSGWIAAHALALDPTHALASALTYGRWAPELAVLLVVLCAAGGAIAGWRLVGPMRPVSIRFDGVAWAADGIAGDLQIMLDLGPPLLLLRLRPADGARARWLALSGARGAGDLHALRTALYSRPPTASRATPASPATLSAVRAPDRATD